MDVPASGSFFSVTIASDFGYLEILVILPVAPTGNSAVEILQPNVGAGRLRLLDA